MKSGNKLDIFVFMKHLSLLLAVKHNPLPPHLPKCDSKVSNHINVVSEPLYRFKGFYHLNVVSVPFYHEGSSALKCGSDATMMELKPLELH